MKDREKADCLGTLRFKEQYGGEFRGFSFSLIQPELVAGRDRNLITPYGNRETSRRKTLLAKETGNEGT